MGEGNEDNTAAIFRAGNAAVKAPSLLVRIAAALYSCSILGCGMQGSIPGREM